MSAQISSYEKKKEAEAAAELHRRSELVKEEEDACQSQIREERTRIQDFYHRALRHLAVQKGVRCHSFDCYLLAIGQGKMIGVYSAAEVAKLYLVTKQASTECIDDFQKLLNVPPLPGQRCEKGRGQMAKARKKQLK